MPHDGLETAATLWGIHPKRLDSSLSCPIKLSPLPGMFRNITKELRNENKFKESRESDPGKTDLFYLPLLKMPADISPEFVHRTARKSQ